MRWLTGLVVVVAALLLAAPVARVAETGLAGAAWLRVSVLVVLVGMAAGCAVLAVRSSPPVDVPQVDEVRGGYGIDGPERRRVRRALRTGTPLRPGDRDRALLQAQQSLATASRGSVSRRERYTAAAAMAYGAAAGLLNSSSLTDPRFASPDLESVVVAASVVAVWWLLTRAETLDRPRRARRARERIARLENHPITA